MVMRTVMWPRQRVIGVAAAALVFATLSGCAPSPAPQHTASPSPHATPVFSSDKEALAAATKAYAAYLKVSDEIAHDGGAHPERIKAVATGEALSDALQGFAEYRDTKAHSVGARRFDHARIQSVDPTTVTFYVCDDVSEVDVLDESGTSLVSPDRPSRTEFVVSASGADVAGVLISSRDKWEGKNVCK